MRMRKLRTLSEINVTSLVDVSLVLLIIFMITAPFISSGIEVDLPKLTADELKVKEGIVVTLTRDGTIYLDQQKVPVANFKERLLKSYIAKGGQLILLKADREVPYGNLMNLMDMIKEAGMSKVGLIVEANKK